LNIEHRFLSGTGRLTGFVSSPSVKSDGSP
jgi:hypothetical protein